MNYCKDIPIQLNIPVKIDEGKLFKYDPNSEYYNDDCNSYTTDNGTDILISDRKKEFGNNNMSLCEINCNYDGYSMEDKQSICNCQAKNNIDLVSEIANNSQKLSNIFTSEEGPNKATNILTIKCTKSLFSKDGLISNISSYVISVSMIYFLLSILLFLKCGYPLLVKQIKDIVQSKKSDKSKKNSNRKNQSQAKNNYINKKKSNAPPKRLNIKRGMNLNISSNKDSNYKFNNDINNKNVLLPINQNKNNLIRRNNDKSSSARIPINNSINNSIHKSKNIITTNNDSKKKSKSKKSEKYNNFELNTLDYMSAINFDKRTFCQYYAALIRIKHPLLFGFCPLKDYNSMIIKLCIFLLSFDIYYVVNFIFFDEKAIHKLYENGGNFDIIYFLPQIAISFGVSNIITIIIKLIFLTERNVVQVRIQTTYIEAEKISQNVKRNIIIKHVIFYILGIIFLFFFWMLLSSFGAVYPNSQMILFECVLISFGISFVYPFFYNFIPCIFRFCSLSGNKKDKECIYNFSKFLQVL